MNTIRPGEEARGSLVVEAPCYMQNANWGGGGGLFSSHAVNIILIKNIMGSRALVTS
jgi:hypothetical protein